MSHAFMFATIARRGREDLWPVIEEFVKHIRPDLINLIPLLEDPAAGQALMLARGQLNLAFRSRGLESPDAVQVADPDAFDPDALENPASLGIEEALHRFEDDFLAWSSRMPRALVPLVLTILQRAYLAQGDDSSESASAVRRAFAYLSGQTEASGDESV